MMVVKREKFCYNLAIMKKLLQYILANLAKKILAKYKPKVVGITGSIGKTSAKEAVFAVLASSFSTRTNFKNYNNELGVPLTIIGSETGGRSIIGWIKVFQKAFQLLSKVDKEYPKMLVLEMGADKPADISYLVDIAPCNVGVVTRIGPAHLEAFKSIENIVKEKQKIVTHLDKNDFAILNYDDELVRKMEKKTEAQVISYGYSEDAQVRAIDFAEQSEGWHIAGIKFKINYKGSVVPVFLPGVVGKHQINSALIGAAVGLSFGMNLIQIANSLKNYHAPLGRMHLIDGKNETLIIDDTYNSSPTAVEAAVKTLAELQVGQVERKVAILGDMLELGDYTEEAHQKIGAQVANLKCDVLVAVGNFAEAFKTGAEKAGLVKENIFIFKDSNLAQNKISDIIKRHDLVLVKGSQGARMERVVKALMKDPGQAPELLVRQSEDWLKE